MKKIKRQDTDWEKTFIIFISDKESATRKYQNLLQFNNKKTNNPI